MPDTQNKNKQIPQKIPKFSTCEKYASILDWHFRKGPHDDMVDMLLAAGSAVELPSDKPLPPTELALSFGPRARKAALAIGQARLDRGGAPRCDADTSSGGQGIAGGGGGGSGGGHLQPGTRVTVDGLRARPDLNRQCGVVVDYAADRQRYRIKMDAHSEQAPGEEMYLRPANLTKLGGRGLRLSTSQLNLSRF